MKINATQILAAVLRQHVRTQLPGKQHDAEIKVILDELSKAGTVAERHAILERLMLRELQAEGSVRSSQVAPPPSPAPEERALWRVSTQSAESMNGLQTQHSSRQWEMEAIIRSIFDNALQDPRDGQSSGLAMPFRPTLQDMARAIEAMGYSTRAFHSEEPRAIQADEQVGGSGTSVIFLVLIFGAVVAGALAILAI